MGASERTLSIEAAMDAMPIFPLPEVVLFPHGLLPLHIFESRYRAMVRDCLATHRTMALALLPAGGAGAEGLPPIARIAGAGVIVEHQPLSEGRANIVIEGRARVRLEELPLRGPYRRARATVLSDVAEAVSATDVTALIASATAFTAEIRKHNPTFTLRVPTQLEPGPLSDYCAHHFVVDVNLRQKLLEELRPSERIRLLTSSLASQHSALWRESGGLLH